MVLSTSAVKYYNPHDFGVTFLSAVFLQQSAVKFCCFICVFCCLLLCLATITHIILLAWEALPFPCQPCSHTHTHTITLKAPPPHSYETTLWLSKQIFTFVYRTLRYNIQQVGWFIDFVTQFHLWNKTVTEDYRSPLKGRDLSKD